jgi:uncharacterized protein YndB with AHSA1/START domain
MNDAATTHHTVTITRTYDVTAARLFAAWADAARLARWYVPGDATWELQIVEHDFRVGGRKHLTFGPKRGPRYSEDCRYEDIVDGRRICFSMTIANDERRMTTSMVTVELLPNGARTELKLTDQLAVLDGSDGPTSAREREAGCNDAEYDVECGVRRRPAVDMCDGGAHPAAAVEVGRKRLRIRARKASDLTQPRHDTDGIGLRRVAAFAHQVDVFARPKLHDDLLPRFAVGIRLRFADDRHLGLRTSALVPSAPPHDLRCHRACDLVDSPHAPALAPEQVSADKSGAQRNPDKNENKGRHVSPTTVKQAHDTTIPAAVENRPKTL